MRTFSNAAAVRSCAFLTVAALYAISVCTPSSAADFRGSVLSRVRSAQTFNAPSRNTFSAFKGSLQTQASGATAGHTLGKRKLNSAAGSMASKAQLDPNAGHTLGKRRLNSGSLSKLGQMQLDPNAGHTLGKRKLNTNAPSGMVPLNQPWQKSRVIAAPNGNTGIIGAGLPAGVNSRASKAARVATPQPQQVMSLLPGVPDWADPVGSAIEYGIDIAAGREELPGQHAPLPEPVGTVETVDHVDPNANHSIGKKKIDPNANHSIGKKKTRIGAADKFDPNASTSIQLPNLPSGGTSSGGSTPPNPAPSAPAPAPAPVPAPQGQIGGGFPWQDVIVGTAIGLANRPVAYETPVYVPVAQPSVMQEVVDEAPAVVEAQPVQTTLGSPDLMLENIELVAPATLLAGPAYRVTFRNQSAGAVGAFRVAIFAGSDGKLSEDAPRAAMEIAGLEGGEVGEAVLRLPAAAMKLVSASSQQPGFSHLVVAVDVTNDVAELDETNNLAVVERTVLESADR